MSPATPGPLPSLTFLARNTRLQMAHTRLTLISRSKRARLALGLSGFVLGVQGAFVLSALAPMLLHHGLAAVVRVYWAELTLLSTIAAAGLGLVGALLFKAEHPLTLAELDGGVLLQLGPDGVAATVRGATVYCDWRHVVVERSSAGLIFVLASSVVHLLPHEAIPKALWGAVAALLAGAGKGALAPGERDRGASFSNPRTIAGYSIE